MNVKRSALAIAMAGALGFGVAEQAAAFVYADSSLEITDLTVNIIDDPDQDGVGTTALTGVTVDTFNFTVTSTAAQDGTGDFDTGTCGGTPSSNSCGAPPAIVLDATGVGDGVSNVGDIIRINNQTSGDGTFTVFGSGGGDWANSDTVIYTSSLTDPTDNTDTDQIAEANLDSGETASATTNIQSITGFTFTFTVTDPGLYSLLLDFQADPDMFAEISELLGGTYSAQANMSAEFSLEQNTDGNGDAVAGVAANWSPEGSAGDDCSEAGGLTCTERADTQDLNLTIGTTTNGTSSSHSWGPNVAGNTAFGITVLGLTEGTWTLTLTSITSVQLLRQPIPEPGVLALLGAGLVGAGFVRRRRRKALVA